MAGNEKSRDFCIRFMNSMEDGRRNPGSRPWTFKTRENPGSRPSTFADCEYQHRTKNNKRSSKESQNVVFINVTTYIRSNFLIMLDRESVFGYILKDDILPFF
jgi:hypothetical protein